MKKIRLYWNNICVLNKGEKLYLDLIREDLIKKGIDLEITYFGLGYPYHLSTYLKRDDAVLPDIMVSTDLEVFEDPVLKRKLSSCYLKIKDVFSIKDDVCFKAIDKGSFLLPYLVIPIILYSEEEIKRVSLEEIVRDCHPITFGGINNSAAKTVIKLVMKLFGKDGVSSFLKNADVTNMPIEAFNKVRKGKGKMALIPSLFSLTSERGDINNLEDGIIALPSYISVLNTLKMEDAKLVIDELNKDEFLNFFKDRGHLIVMKNGFEKEKVFENDTLVLLFPDTGFIDSLKEGEFVSYYGKLMGGRAI